MKLRKIGLYILALILCMQCFVPMVSAQREKVTFEVLPPSTSGGETTVTILALSVPQTTDVTLVAAYIKEDGQILSINVTESEFTSAGDEISVTVQDKTADGGIFQYYVWDSLSSMAPLRNGAPAAPTTAETADNTYTTTDISWDSALDDYDDELTYNVYDEGMLVKSGLTEKETQIDGLYAGETYNFEVTAADTDGLESADYVICEVNTDKLPEVVTAGENTINIVDATEAVAPNPLNLIYVDADTVRSDPAHQPSKESYALSKIDVMEGVECRRNDTIRSTDNSFLSFRFNDEMKEYIKAECEQTEDHKIDMVLEFTYLDNHGSASTKEHIQLLSYISKYSGSAWGNPAADYPSVLSNSYTGTGEWKTIRKAFKLNGYYVDNTSGNQYFNIRMINNTNNAHHISMYRLAIYPKSLYNPTDAYFKADVLPVDVENENNTENTVPRPLINLGMNFDAEGATNPVVKDGKGAVKASEFTFRVTDSNLINQSTFVEVNYFAAEDDTLTIAGTSVAVKGGKWQKVRVNLASLENSDYTIQTASGNDIYIHSVRVDFNE